MCSKTGMNKRPRRSCLMCACNEQTGHMCTTRPAEEMQMMHLKKPESVENFLVLCNSHVQLACLDDRTLPEADDKMVWCIYIARVQHALCKHALYKEAYACTYNFLITCMCLERYNVRGWQNSSFFVLVCNFAVTQFQNIADLQLSTASSESPLDRYCIIHSKLW